MNTDDKAELSDKIDEIKFLEGEFLEMAREFEARGASWKDIASAMSCGLVSWVLEAASPEHFLEVVKLLSANEVYEAERINAEVIATRPARHVAAAFEIEGKTDGSA